MKIYAPPLTTWMCHTLSVRTTNWPTSLTTTTSPWWLTTATCARTSRYRMANSAPNCALTSKAAKSYWWVADQCRLTDISLIADGGYFILIADNGDLCDEIKIPDGELGFQLQTDFVSGKELLVICRPVSTDRHLSHLGQRLLYSNSWQRRPARWSQNIGCRTTSTELLMSCRQADISCHGYSKLTPMNCQSRSVWLLTITDSELGLWVADVSCPLTYDRHLRRVTPTLLKGQQWRP